MSTQQFIPHHRFNDDDWYCVRVDVEQSTLVGSASGKIWGRYNPPPAPVGCIWVRGMSAKHMNLVKEGRQS